VQRWVSLPSVVQAQYPILNAEAQHFQFAPAKSTIDFVAHDEVASLPYLIVQEVPRVELCNFQPSKQAKAAGSPERYSVADEGIVTEVIATKS
jgi:hypothetical protein